MSATSKYRPWSAAERTIVRKRYIAEGPGPIAARLGRSWKAVVMRAQAMCIFRQSRRWSQIEDHRLRNALEEVSLGWAARRLKRSPRALYDRAVKIGLPVGCPPGFERLSAAARRTGYDVKTLRRILQWSEVKLRLVIAQPNDSRSKSYWHQHMVDVDDVDHAVERWMLLETPAAAARRLGFEDKKIVRTLLESGLELPPRLGHRPWRVPSDLIDRAMGARQERAA